MTGLPICFQDKSDKILNLVCSNLMNSSSVKTASMGCCGEASNESKNLTAPQLNSTTGSESEAAITLRTSDET